MYSAALGFEIGAHALRATAATNALDHEADIAKVQEWLGHSNIAMTRIYDHRKTRPEDSPTFNGCLLGRMPPLYRNAIESGRLHREEECSARSSCLVGAPRARSPGGRPTSFPLMADRVESEAQAELDDFFWYYIATESGSIEIAEIPSPSDFFGSNHVDAHTQFIAHFTC